MNMPAPNEAVKSYVKEVTPDVLEFFTKLGRAIAELDKPLDEQVQYGVESLGLTEDMAYAAVGAECGYFCFEQEFKRDAMESAVLKSATEGMENKPL